MGLEATTFISGLTASWPVAGDPKGQGDDHLRLIKSVLQSTFPTATKAFYFPSLEASSALVTLDATDQGKLLSISTGSGDVPITLPGGLTAGDAGWSCEVMKITYDANAAVVSPVSGTMLSQSGVTSTIRVGALCEPARFVWNGGLWVCVKPGIPIGTAINWDGPPSLFNFLTLDGSSFSSTTYPELYNMLGSVTTLPDKRGRVDIGVGTGSGLTNRTRGVAYGSETFTLGAANLPPYTPAGTISITGSTAIKFQTYNIVGGSGPQIKDTVGPSTSSSDVFTGSGTFTGTAQGGTSTPVSVLTPSIGSYKLIRAC